MEALRIIQRPQNGKLIITVPEEMSEALLEVVVSMKHNFERGDRVEIAEKFKAIMPVSGYQVKDEEVYEQ